MDEYSKDSMRFKLQPGAELGFWELTDTSCGVGLKFREHHYNDEQEMTGIDGKQFDVMELARIMRRMADYMFRFHQNLI